MGPEKSPVVINHNQSEESQIGSHFSGDCTFIIEPVFINVFSSK